MLVRDSDLERCISLLTKFWVCSVFKTAADGINPIGARSSYIVQVVIGLFFLLYDLSDEKCFSTVFFMAPHGLMIK